MCVRAEIQEGGSDKIIIKPGQVLLSSIKKESRKLNHIET